MYYSCNAKRPYLAYCFENKECLTESCASNYCSGSAGLTYINYTTNLPNTGWLSASQSFDINVSYYDYLNNELITGAACSIRVDGTTYGGGGSWVSCDSQISIYLPIGTHTVSIIAWKTGYVESTTPEISVTVYSSTVNASIGDTCTSNTECTTGRCEYLTEYYYRQCYGDADCPDGICEDYVPGYWFSGTFIPPVAGMCSERVSYGVCVANDYYQACDPTQPNSILKCLNSYQGYECNPLTYTCSKLSQKPAGATCSERSECETGLMCLPNSDNTTKYCCAASSMSKVCCNVDLECASGYICDSYIIGGTYVCITPYGGAPNKPCNVHEDCDVESGYGCIPYADGTKKCLPFASTCPSTSPVPCAYCETNRSLSISDCRAQNLTVSIVCTTSSNECRMAYNGQVTPSPSTPVDGEVDIEYIFNQMIQLIWYTVTVVVIFFIIALFIAMAHLAYGLVKR